MPIRALPGSGDRAVASLIANQASLEVADALTQAMGELAHGLGPDVVVLTISSAEEDILKSYNLHANCFVTKPIDLDQFMKVVHSVEDFWLTIVKLPNGGS